MSRDSLPLSGSVHEDEGPHPFTLSSAWTGDGRIQFIIRALGDYTGTLADRLRVGDPVKVEGPYGRFNFREPSRQIWSGGIGITPVHLAPESLDRDTRWQGD